MYLVSGLGVGPQGGQECPKLAELHIKTQSKTLVKLKKWMTYLVLSQPCHDPVKTEPYMYIRTG